MKKLIKKISQFLKNLFSKAKWLVSSAVEPSVLTVEQIKKAVNSPIVDIATTVIPGTLDNKIVSKIRALLPKVLIALNYIKEGEVVAGAIQKIAEMSPDGRKAAFHNIATLLSVYLSDGKLTWTEAVHLSEMVYKESNLKQ